jgi:hypothetical protein
MREQILNSNRLRKQICTENIHFFLDNEFEIKALLVWKMEDQLAVMTPSIVGDFSQGCAYHGDHSGKRELIIVEGGTLTLYQDFGEHVLSTYVYKHSSQYFNEVYS